MAQYLSIEDFNTDKKIYPDLLEKYKHECLRECGLFELIDWEDRIAKDYFSGVVDIYPFLKTVKFTENIEIRRRVENIFGENTLKYFIPLATLDKHITFLESSISYVFAKTLTLYCVSEYLESKISAEILDNNHPHKLLIKFFRRKAENSKHRTKIQEEIELDQLINKAERIVGDSGITKKGILAFSRGQPEKIYAQAIYGNINLEIGNKMGKVDFYTVLFEFYRNIFKDLEWLKKEEFDDTEEKSLAYGGNYNKYRWRCVDSLLR